MGRPVPAFETGKTKPAFLLALALRALSSAAFVFPAAAAPAVDCAPQAAAGKPAPPAPSAGRENAFKILWHIGTQTEALADADGNADVQRAIETVRKQIAGYYITVHANQLGYWPERPPDCAVNFPRASDRLGWEKATELRRGCQRSFLASVKSKGAEPQSVYLAALERTLQNLHVRNDQANGKIVLGQMLLQRDDFDFDEATGRLELRKLPTTYCFLNALGLTLNNALAYQEPRPQRRIGTFLFVPPDGRPADRQPLPSDALPYNVRLLDGVADSFSRSTVPLSRFSIDLRVWNEAAVRAIEKADQKHLGGILFEGGTDTISPKGRPGRVDNFAEGMAWLLTNTQHKIFVLMPGFWEKPAPLSAEDLDEIIPRLRTMVTLLDQKIAQHLPSRSGQHPICNSRFHFIPANYGAPTHPPPLPIEREGHKAGTVAGQIMALAGLRDELCGGAN